MSILVHVSTKVSHTSSIAQSVEPMRLTLVPTLFDHFFKGIRGLIIHIRHAHLDQVDGDPHQWIRYQAIPYDDAILLSESEDPKEPVMIANGEMGPMP